jgi:hypothetical protein
MWRMRVFVPTQIKIFLVLLIITEVKFKDFETFKRKIHLNNIDSHSLWHRKYVVTDWLMQFR